MIGLGVLFVVIAVGLAAAWQIRQNPHITRGVGLRTLGLMVGYFLIAGISPAIMFWVIDGPQPQDRAAALTVFLAAWILFSGLWLMRIVPRFAEPPAWLMARWGIADLALLLLMAGSLAYVLLI